MQDIWVPGGFMQPLPHYYEVTATADEDGNTEIASNGLTSLVSAPPEQFDGPGNLWSPETLMMAAVADCFVITFRAIANMSKLCWTSIVCDAKGALDRSDGGIRFTSIQLYA